MTEDIFRVYNSLEKLDWRSRGGLESKSYKCGYCGQSLASNEGYFATSINGGSAIAYLYVCHFCHQPTFFSQEGKQFPGVTYGNEVTGIDEQEVEKLYDEARRCFGASAYSAVVMLSRKLLMHIAVNKGAEEKKRFEYYVNYLSEKNLIPEGSKGWVDKIRNVGNSENHEIKISTKEEAEKILKFTEMLLKIIYEFPSELD